MSEYHHGVGEEPLRIDSEYLGDFGRCQGTINPEQSKGGEIVPKRIHELVVHHFSHRKYHDNAVKAQPKILFDTAKEIAFFAAASAARGPTAGTTA